jgi:hypothetical protein
LAVAAGCSVLGAWCLVLGAWPTAAGVTPRAATMFGMDTPATTRNRTLSRSGLGSVAISAGSRAPCRSSMRRWLGTRESAVAADAGWAGGGIGGGNTEVSPPRAAPPPGPVAVLVCRAPTSGSGCRPLESARPWSTGAWVAPPTSARHAGRNARDQSGDIMGWTPARRVRAQTIATILERACLPPDGWVFGESPNSWDAGVRSGCARDSSRIRRDRKPIRPVKRHAGRGSSGADPGSRCAGSQTAACSWVGKCVISAASFRSHRPNVAEPIAERHHNVTRRDGVISRPRMSVCPLR